MGSCGSYYLFYKLPVNSKNCSIRVKIFLIVVGVKLTYFMNENMYCYFNGEFNVAYFEFQNAIITIS